MTRRILITGAGARIGQHLALALAKSNWHVILHFNRSKSGAEETLNQITQAGGTGELLQADLQDHQQCCAVFPQLNANSGPVHGLINNASIFENDHLDNLDEPLWDRQFAINVKAPVFLSQGFAAQLPDDAKGHIIHLLDQRLSRPGPDFFSYTLSKAALATATKTMAQALAPNIQVNAIAPGPTLQGARQTKHDFKTQQLSTLLGRGSPPKEIVDAALYLLGSQAVTGQILTVDGGQHLARPTGGISE